MHSRFYPGERVETIKPAKESSDWSLEAKKHRRWGVSGKVVGHSDSHGLCFEVEHEDGTKGWYEPRELRVIDVYGPEERAAMLKKMERMARDFYPNAVETRCHPWIEFTGLMNEYLQVCVRAHSKGIDFSQANTHTGKALPFESYNASYLAEKLNCIYGPSLLASAESREAFIEKLFDGQFELVPKRVIQTLDIEDP